MIVRRIEELLQEDRENSKKSSDDEFAAFNDESMVSDFGKDAKNNTNWTIKDDIRQVKKLNPKNAEFIPKLRISKPTEIAPKPIDSGSLQQIVTTPAIPDLQQTIKCAKLQSGNIFIDDRRLHANRH